MKKRKVDSPPPAGTSSNVDDAHIDVPNWLNADESNETELEDVKDDGLISSTDDESDSEDGNFTACEFLIIVELDMLVTCK